MRIQSIRFENYKAFKSFQKIDIRPLTIVIGKNNTGKSAVVRLPLLLAHAFSSRTNGIIETQFDNLHFGNSFKDIIYNKFDHGKIRFALDVHTNNKDIHINATVQNIAGQPLQIVSEYTLTINDTPQLDISWLPDDLQPPFVTYQNNLKTDESIVHAFEGLVPAFMQTSQNVTSLKKIRHLLQDRFFIDYLGPFRQVPEPIYTIKSSMPQSIGYTGENAPLLLALDYLYNGGKLVEKVNQWFEKSIDGWNIEVTGREYFNIILKRKSNPHLSINLNEAGAGIGQILPLVVNSFYQNGKDKHLSIIEQPELHLHPAAHGSIAELLAQLALEQHKDLLIETHSKNFILRIRKLIAEGKMESTDAIIYYIYQETGKGSQIRPIHIDENGEVDFWPEGIFTEGFEEVRAIRQAQRHKKELL